MDKLLLNTHVVVEPKAKKKYKTKKEKDKDVVVQELIIVAQTMVGEELHDEEAQSLKDNVEETIKPPPQKTKKKRQGKMRWALAKPRPMKRLFPLSNKESEGMR